MRFSEYQTEVMCFLLVFFISIFIVVVFISFLTFTTLWADLADTNWLYFSYFSQKKGTDISCNFFSKRENLHEMSKPFLWEKI